MSWRLGTFSAALGPLAQRQDGLTRAFTVVVIRVVSPFRPQPKAYLQSQDFSLLTPSTPPCKARGDTPQQGLRMASARAGIVS